MNWRVTWMMNKMSFWTWDFELFLRFFTLEQRTNRQTNERNRPTDRSTDQASYRGAMAHLKLGICEVDDSPFSRSWLQIPKPAKFVGPSVRRSVGPSSIRPSHFTFLALMGVLALLLLPKCSTDLNYVPCPPARDWGSRVSGLVFFFNEKDDDDKDNVDDQDTHARAHTHAHAHTHAQACTHT